MGKVAWPHLLRNFGANWVSPGWATNTGGTVTGTANIYSPSANNPAFVNVALRGEHKGVRENIKGSGLHISQNDKLSFARRQWQDRYA